MESWRKVGSQQTNSTEREFHLGFASWVGGARREERILALQSSTAFSMRRVPANAVRREEKRREGRDSREGRRKREGLSERRSSPGGEFVVFDDGSIRLIRLLRSGDWRFESERKR